MPNKSILYLVLLLLVSGVATAADENAIQNSQTTVGNPALAENLQQIDSQLQVLQEMDEEIVRVLQGPPEEEDDPVITEQLTNIVRVLQGTEGEEDPPVAGITGQIRELEARLQAMEQQIQAIGSAVGVGPDLIPTALSQSCFRSNGNLVVEVKNVGSAVAPASTVRVVFATSGGDVSVDGAIPALSPTTSAQQLIDIPSGCFAPDCYYSVIVDSLDEVSEVSESNNAVDGACLG